MAQSHHQTVIYLLRHCRYANSRRILPFRLPGFPLSSSGRACARKLAVYFSTKNISAIYTSPILRTRETATIIGAKLKIKPVVAQAIIETKSPFQGWSKVKFEKLGVETFLHPDYLRHHGETLDQLFDRVKKFIIQVIKKHAGESILIVSHGDPIMATTYGLVDGDPNLFLAHTRPYVPMGGGVKLVISTHSPVLASIRVRSYSYLPAPLQTKR